MLSPWLGQRMQFAQLRRREAITLLGGAAAAWPLVARAQLPGERMRHIGVLLPAAGEDPEYQARIGEFQQGLQEAGWSIGRNVRMDTRWATANAASIHKQAAELAALMPERHSGSRCLDRGDIAAGDPHHTD